MIVSMFSRNDLPIFLVRSVTKRINRVDVDVDVNGRVSDIDDSNVRVKRHTWKHPIKANTTCTKMFVPIFDVDIMFWHRKQSSESRRKKSMNRSRHSSFRKDPQMTFGGNIQSFTKSLTCSKIR